MLVVVLKDCVTETKERTRQCEEVAPSIEHRIVPTDLALKCAATLNGRGE